MGKKKINKIVLKTIGLEGTLMDIIDKINEIIDHLNSK